MGLEAREGADDELELSFWAEDVFELDPDDRQSLSLDEDPPLVEDFEDD